jgi:hypothetical protein
MLFKNSYRTSKKTQHFSITKIHWLMLFMEILTVRMGVLRKPLIQNRELLILKVGGAYSYTGLYRVNFAITRNIREDHLYRSTNQFSEIL